MRNIHGYGPSIVVLVTAVLVLIGGPAIIRHLEYVQTESRVMQASHRLAGNDSLEQINQAVRDVATVIEPSVVHISARRPIERDRFGNVIPRGDSTGSGWIFDEDGHIVTNYHVIHDAEQIEVQLYNGAHRRAEVVGTHPATDIAVLRIARNSLHPAPRADVEESLRQGDRVFAFGSPFDFRFSMSSGIISGLGRSGGQSLGISFQDFIQVDAAINPGNSGGPLTNARGQVIGMNTAIATNRSRTAPDGQFSGIGLAIPISMIEPIVTQIIETGTVVMGYLGITMDELNQNVARSLNFEGKGVLVNTVEPERPAERAGLRSKDIITHIDGRPIATMEQLRARISSRGPGESVTIEVWRGHDEVEESRTFDVTLTEFDTLRADWYRYLQLLGFDRLVTATPEEAARFELTPRPGVLIARLGPSRLTGFGGRIEPGMIITHVMGQPIDDLDAFYEELKMLSMDIPAELTIVDADGRRQIIELPAL